LPTFYLNQYNHAGPSADSLDNKQAHTLTNLVQRVRQHLDSKGLGPAALGWEGGPSDWGAGYGYGDNYYAAAATYGYADPSYANAGYATAGYDLSGYDMSGYMDGSAFAAGYEETTTAWDQPPEEQPSDERPPGV